MLPLVYLFERLIMTAHRERETERMTLYMWKWYSTFTEMWIHTKEMQCIGWIVRNQRAHGMEIATHIIISA